MRGLYGIPLIEKSELSMTVPGWADAIARNARPMTPLSNPCSFFEARGAFNYLNDLLRDPDPS